APIGMMECWNIGKMGLDLRLDSVPQGLCPGGVELTLRPVICGPEAGSERILQYGVNGPPRRNDKV
ncbi:MAG: hypothetical protein WBM69_27980, partial [Desulfobacterales bacterium]